METSILTDFSRYLDIIRYDNFWAYVIIIGIFVVYIRVMMKLQTRGNPSKRLEIIVTVAGIAILSFLVYRMYVSAMYDGQRVIIIIPK